MKGRPILFSGPMIRALLAGTKTQTRRVVKRQPPEEYGQVFTGLYHPTVIDRHGDEQPGTETYGAWTGDGEWAIRCPYGKPGDLLWVREAFRTDEECPPSQSNPICTPIWFGVDGSPTAGDGCWTHLRPGIHMPRWASRLTIRITDVRVQRLQECSTADAMAEGIGTPLDDRYAAAHEYRALWESINGPDSWDANPWVWAVTFEVFHENIDAHLKRNESDYALAA